MGATPHNRAQAGSERTRSGLSPATMSISAAVSAPTPKAALSPADSRKPGAPHVNDTPTP